MVSFFKKFQSAFIITRPVHSYRAMHADAPLYLQRFTRTAVDINIVAIIMCEAMNVRPHLLG